MGVEVTDNPTLGRYEARIEGVSAGVADYRRDGSAITVDHVEVALERRGEGIASALAAGLLDDVRGRGLRVRPRCPFFVAYLARHPEQHDLLAPGESVDGAS